MDDKLKQLEEVTNRITTNVTTMLNTAKTSDYGALQAKITEDLYNQNILRSQTGIDKSNSNNKQINSIKSSLQSQDKIYQNFNLNQKSNIGNIDKSIAISGKINTNLNQKTSQSNTQNKITSQQISSQSGLNRTDADIGEAAKFVGIKAGKAAFKSANEWLQDAGIPYVSAIAKGIVALIKIAENLLEAANDVITITHKFADRLEKVTGSIDEGMRSSLLSMGMSVEKAFGSKTKVDKVVDNILNSGRYMVQQLEIPFDPIKVAEFQKAYAELSKTTVSFHETDYALLGTMQTTLNLSAEEAANLSKTFIDMGSDIDYVSKFFTSLIQESTKVGVNSKELIKDMGEYMDSTELFRFQGGIQDMTRVMAYAKRIKLDMGGMFKLMDVVSEPDAAIDLAAQLQALDTSFLGLDSIDLMGAAMTDVDKFGKMITQPFMDHIEKYYDVKMGQLTQFGANFSKSFVKLEGINQLFKSEKEFTEFLMKQGKEKEVRNAIMNSAESYAAMMQLTPTEQENIIGVLAAQYQRDNRGLRLEGGLYVDKLSASEMKGIMANPLKGKDAKEQLEIAAKGTVSVKDREEVNKMLLDSMMQNKEAINAVNKAFMDKDYRDQLKFVGNTIMDVGLEVYTNTSFKQMEVMQMLGLTAEESYLFHELLVKDATTFVGGIKGMIEMIPYLSLGMIDLNEDKTTPPKITVPTQAMKSAVDAIKKKSQGGVVSVSSISFPKNSIRANPSFVGPSVSSKQLQNLLSTLMTNQFGPGILTLGSGGDTKVVVSGEIRNYINDKDAGTITGEKVLQILEKQLV